ncbi:hypothetical protein DVH24_034717 [Malus domestica]|uniref:F-box domain-containing protein n=1 Tax=Malus domestica TaxID=3750 RepID=A0A498IZY4_MALDO|nr:hypothetical protein DVH24_034717 [Malus domestica]
MKKGTTAPTFIQSLPNELFLEILTKAAFRSFHFLYSVKMVCKKFNQLTQHDRIFEHINIQIFKKRRHEEVYKFLEWCTKCNNPVAMYTQGMRWYFRYNNFELEIKSMKTAISKHHQALTYVYGAILVCRGDERERGLNLLHSPKRQKLMMLPSKHATTVEVHKVLSQSDPIEVFGAMTNSVATIRREIWAAATTQPRLPFRRRSHDDFFDNIEYIAILSIISRYFDDNETDTWENIGVSEKR